MQVKTEKQAHRYVRIGWMQCDQIVFRGNTKSQKRSGSGCHQAIMESENREQESKSVIKNYGEIVKCAKSSIKILWLSRKIV